MRGTGWVLGMMIPFFGVLKLLGLFRVPPDVETIGLDISHHGVFDPLFIFIWAAICPGCCMHALCQG
jgi:hypothetical protein